MFEKFFSYHKDVWISAPLIAVLQLINRSLYCVIIVYHMELSAILGGHLPLGQLKENEHYNDLEAHSVAAPVVSR